MQDANEKMSELVMDAPATTIVEGDRVGSRQPEKSNQVEQAPVVEDRAVEVQKHMYQVLDQRTEEGARGNAFKAFKAEAIAATQALGPNATPDEQRVFMANYLAKNFARYRDGTATTVETNLEALTAQKRQELLAPGKTINEGLGILTGETDPNKIEEMKKKLREAIFGPVADAVSGVAQDFLEGIDFNEFLQYILRGGENGTVGFSATGGRERSSNNEISKADFKDRYLDDLKTSEKKRKVLGEALNQAFYYAEDQLELAGFELSDKLSAAREGDLDAIQDVMRQLLIDIFESSEKKPKRWECFARVFGGKLQSGAHLGADVEDFFLELHRGKNKDDGEFAKYFVKAAEKDTQP